MENKLKRKDERTKKGKRLRKGTGGYSINEPVRGRIRKNCTENGGNLPNTASNTRDY